MGAQSEQGKLRFSILEAASILGIGRTRLYEHIKEGSIPTVKDGTRTLILRDELERFASTGISRKRGV